MDEREAALAESPAICGTLVTPSVTSAQLSKLQELRQKRLQLKKAGHPSAGAAKPKKPHGHKRTMNLEGIVIKEIPNTELSSTQDQGGLVGKQDLQTAPSVQSGQKTERKRQKLFWGLDTKERWERKGNM